MLPDLGLFLALANLMVSGYGCGKEVQSRRFDSLVRNKGKRVLQSSVSRTRAACSLASLMSSSLAHRRSVWVGQRELRIPWLTH